MEWLSDYDREVLDDGWQGGLRLYDHLAGGGEIFDALPAAELSLSDDEPCYAPSEFEYARLYAMDVTVTLTETRPSLTDRIGSVFHPLELATDAINKAYARRDFEKLKRRARREATAHWQDQCFAPVLLTPARLLCEVDAEWFSFWFVGVTEISVDLTEWYFALWFDDGDPLLLRGPDAPWYALAVAYLTYGADGLTMPAFASLAAGSAGSPAQ